MEGGDRTASTTAALMACTGPTLSRTMAKKGPAPELASPDGTMDGTGETGERERLLESEAAAAAADEVGLGRGVPVMGCGLL